MIENRRLRVYFSLCLLAFILVICGAASPTLAQCENVSDDEIVADIYGKIKANTALAPQASHINISSTNFIVKFVGWADNKKDYDKIRNFANVSCVRMINVNGFFDTPPTADSPLRAGNCASGTKQCGDVCIPEADSCNITGGTKP